MKIFFINAGQDLPVEILKALIGEAISLYQN